MPYLVELERRRCRSDKSHFLANHVLTKDPTDPASAVRKFPTRQEKAYCYLLADRWEEYDRLLIPKSRRMIASWTFCGLWGWDAGFKEGRHNFLTSKKETDAGDLVDRVEFICKRPVELGLFTKPIRRRSPHELYFPDTDSRVTGVPSGSDQLRQYGSSNLLLDEAAFHPDLEAVLGASAATSLGSGNIGKVVLLSSANTGSYMEKLVFDLVEQEQAA